MTDGPLDAWWKVIGAARWFGGKGLPGRVTALAPLPWLTASGTLPAVRPEVATIAYDDGRTDRYHLLTGYTTAPEAAVVTWVDDPVHGTLAVVDATADPGCMRALLTGLTDAGNPAMEWLDSTAIDPAAPTRVWPGEQSNTTVCVGDDRLFKVFRKLEPGRNLDVEVLAALNDSGSTPRLFGTLVGDLPCDDPAGTARADLGMFVERVAGVRDGWQWAVERCASERDITAEAGDLGVALKAVHRQLAEAFGTGAVEGDDLAAAMIGRLDAAVAEVPELGRFAAAARRSLGGLAGRRLATQRVHGDFHLGQTLRSADGWTIIDFEGEPLKPLAQRRLPDSVWRDVAGMLRSFDYVRGAHSDPTSPQARAWSSAARAAFLDGYCAGSPPDAPVLDAYELEKAVYEVVYEARNRPNWVHIPLGAVHDLARRTALVPTHNQEEN